MNPGWVLERVTSGGQTGVDQVALERAQHNRLRTGGWVPKGWRTDEGPAPWLKDRYGCREHWSPSYGPRTDRNVYDSEAVVWFGEHSPGYNRTRGAARRYNKPMLENPSVSELQEFILHLHLRVLMVGGNRLRTNPQASELAQVVLSAGLLPF